MGCDSISTNDDTCSAAATPKIGRFGDKLIGFAGSWEGSRVLDVARRWPDLSLSDVMFKVGRFEDDDLILLCIERARLFTVQGPRVFIEKRKRAGIVYEAIGSGDAVALGALYADPYKDRHALSVALRAAAHHTPTVRGPFRIVGL